MDEPSQDNRQQASAKASSRGGVGPAARDWTALHLWQIQPVRDCLWIVVVAFLVWAGYQLRSIFSPVLIALGLAYLASPFVDLAQRRWRIPRPAAISLIDRLQDDPDSLAEVGKAIRRLFHNSEFPADVQESIRGAYGELCDQNGRSDMDVAVLSSATAEDLPEASFAGQQETFLNITGEDELLEACRKCYASLFTDRAIAYREEKGFDHLDVALSVGVQKMVRSDRAGAGVTFSIDTETGFPDAVVINAAWGLGENVVQGSINPDEYVVFKPLLEDPSLTSIIDKSRGAKEKQMVYAAGGSQATKNVDTPKHKRQAFVLSNDEILTLARWAVAIEAHYGKPMDMEWAKDGDSGKLFIVQARPETVQSQKTAQALKTYRLKEHCQTLLTGLAIGQGIAAGKACVIRSADEIDRFEDGAMLVTEMTDPDFKTNEYADVIGGAPFEPHEENPMLGFRGASRYYSDRYREGFALECRAIRRVRDKIGMKNVVVMIPFCRTPEEADRVLEVLAEQGLERGQDRLCVYCMAEIPSNVVLAEEFARRFHAFSIGSNDLTQLILGVGRDSAELRDLFDERHPAVKRTIAQLVAAAHEHGTKVGICGQSPSDYPDFAGFLVEHGIDAMSLNPDSVVEVKRCVAEVEQRGAAK